jgi:hypothetical protein
MRYFIALIAAALIIGAGVLYVRQTNQSMEQLIRQAFLRQQQAGTLPPELQGVDIQNADLKTLGDFGMQLPAATERRLKWAMLLSEYWYVLAPLVTILCLAAAALYGSAMKAEKILLRRVPLSGAA